MASLDQIIEAFPGKQHHDNCGLEAVAQIIALASHGKENLEKAEETVLDAAINPKAPTGTPSVGKTPYAAKDGKNPKKSGRSSAKQRQKLLADCGIDSLMVTTTVKALAKAIEEKKGIIANVECHEFWKLWRTDAELAHYHGGHAIVITGGVFGGTGQLSHVFINDTGINHKGKVKITYFMHAAHALRNSDGSPRTPQLNVTVDPIW